MTYLVYAFLGSRPQCVGFIHKSSDEQFAKDWMARRTDLIERGYTRPFYNTLDFGY